MEAMSDAARRDGSMAKQWKLFLREPLVAWVAKEVIFPCLGMVNQLKGCAVARRARFMLIWARTIMKIE